MVRDAMARVGLRQQDLGDLVGRTQSNVSRWVKGKSRPPAELVVPISEALHLEPMHLLFTWWPELASVDRLGELRALLADASDEVLAEVVTLTRGLVDRDGRGLSGEARPRGSA